MNERSQSQTRSGVYTITNTKDGNVYVGSSVNISKRWRNHRKMLLAGNHHSKWMQRVWNKQGEQVFSFQVLEYCSPDECLAKEQHYIDTLRPKYNTCPTAGSPKGRKLSKKEVERLKSMNAGKNNPFYGKKHGPETRKLISERVRGKLKGKYVGDKNPMYQKTHSDENRALMSQKSREYWNSPDGLVAKAKKSARMKGKPNQFALRGKSHPKYDATERLFINKVNGEKFVGTTLDFRKKYNLPGEIYYLIKGIYKQYKGWEINHETVTK